MIPSTDELRLSPWHQNDQEKNVGQWCILLSWKVFETLFGHVFDWSAEKIQLGFFTRLVVINTTGASYAQQCTP
jgi:hypothetical protein